mgnify:CR=1 FL=1
MKKYRLFSAIIILIMVLFPFCEKVIIPEEQSPFEIYCDSLEEAGIIDNYEFPILPGTPEYEALTTEQRDSVMQIPEAVLETMCTAGLIETCFKYPRLWIYMLASENFEHAIYYFTHSFNGGAVLFERSDAPEKMLPIYRDFNEYPYSDTITNVSGKNDLGAKLVFLELFFSQESSLSVLSSQNKYILGQRAKYFWQLKNDYYHIEFSLHPSSSSFLMGRMMFYDDYGPFIVSVGSNNYLASYIKWGNQYYDESLDEIQYHFDNYLNNLE